MSARDVVEVRYYKHGILTRSTWYSTKEEARQAVRDASDPFGSGFTARVVPQHEVKAAKRLHAKRVSK